jgi:hypothetical protein
LRAGCAEDLGALGIKQTDETRCEMSYRVYSGPPGSAGISPFAKSQALFKEFGALDDALSWARHLQKGGRVPLLIEGDDGTWMDRREIGQALGAGERSQVGGTSAA